MKESRQWVNWRLVEREGKLTKPPLNPATGTLASCDNPATWGSYEDARRASKLIGFQLQPPYVAIDLDKCRDKETGEIEPWASKIIEKLDSYTEISPSGTGIHILVRGKLPTGPRRKGNIEIYDGARYITVTGNTLNQNGVQDRVLPLLEVYRETFYDRNHGVKVADYGGDQSRADLALASKLALKTNGNREEIDRLFRESDHMRKKWDEKHYANGQTYGEHTIEKAVKDIQGGFKVYSGKELRTMKFPEQQYLIGPNLLPKAGRAMITAENATGKSSMLLYISACLATGTPLFGFKNTHKDGDYGKATFPVLGKFRVLYLDYETPHGIRKDKRLAPLAIQFGRDFDENIIFPEHSTKFRLDDDGYANLKALVAEQRPDVLILDPMSSTHCMDENSSLLKVVFNRIDEIIDDYHPAVILAHHASTKKLRNLKGEKIEKDAKEKARGWSGITDWLDLDIHVEEEKQPGGKQDAKILRLDFAKVRYNRAPKTRRIQANLETMTFEPLSEHD